MNTEVLLRDFEVTDESYVYATWLKHLRHSSPWAKQLKLSEDDEKGFDAIYYRNFHKLIKRTLNKENVYIDIACAKDSPEVIVGYVVWQGTKANPVVHFIYVKRSFRLMKVASTMLEGFNLSKAAFTHWTVDCGWIKKKLPSLVYDPYCV